MCELIGYCPELGARIWSEIVDRMLRIDVSLALGFSVPFYRIASARIMEDVPLSAMKRCVIWWEALTSKAHEIRITGQPWDTV
jgi:hypothetical protein